MKTTKNVSSRPAQKNNNVNRNICFTEEKTTDKFITQRFDTGFRYQKSQRNMFKLLRVTYNGNVSENHRLSEINGNVFLVVLVCVVTTFIIKYISVSKGYKR